MSKTAGATVHFQPKEEYGTTCLKGVDYITPENTKPDIVVFLDGDYRYHPSEPPKIVSPILDDTIDYVLGARVKKILYIEFPVKYRKRIDVSKVSGTAKGAIFAGVKNPQLDL